MPCPLRVFTKYHPTTYKRVSFQDENIEANGAIVSLVSEDIINFKFLLNTSDVPGMLLLIDARIMYCNWILVWQNISNIN